MAALVASGDVTAAELLAAARERASKVNPRINAIVRWIDVEAPEKPAGTFGGVPFLLKDLHQDLEGVPTASGSRSLSELPAKANATVVQRWLDAGLVIFGKTNTPEFGAKGITEPVLFGPARNPWNSDHTPGGSSGGAAASVAAGIIPVAAASDGGGSIRIPASACGLFGLKASRGLIPSGPVMGEGLNGMATQGCVSRSVRDTAAMLDVLAGADPDAPFLPATPAGSYLDEVGQDPGKLRIGVRVPSAITPSPDPEAAAAVAAAVALLEAAGHSVEELPAAPFADAALARDFLLLWFVMAAVTVDAAKSASGCGDEGFELDTSVMAALGRATSSVDYAAALERRQSHVARLAEFHRDYDLLLTPTTASPPPKVGQFDLPAPARVAASALVKAGLAGQVLPRIGLVNSMIDDNLGWVPYTQLANLTGRPAMSVPLHWTPGGLPMGVQFVGSLGSEGVLLRLAAQLEEAAPWFQKRPPEQHR